jgi:hypothetical protein
MIFIDMGRLDVLIPFPPDARREFSELSHYAVSTVRSHESTKSWFDKLTTGACPEPVEGCFRVFVAGSAEQSLPASFLIDGKQHLAISSSRA